MGQKWDKFVLLMWKNWILQYRKPIQTLVEILAPVLFSILLVLIRSLVDPTEYPDQHYTSFCPTFLCQAEKNFSLLSTIPSIGADSDSGHNFTRYILFYPENNHDVRSIMLWFNIALLPLAYFNLDVKVKGFNATEDLENFYANDANGTLAAIEFRGELDPFPDNVPVTLRFPGELRSSQGVLGPANWKTNLLYPLYEVPGPRNYNRTEGGDPNYYREQFLSLQYFMTKALLLHKKFTPSKAVVDMILDKYDFDSIDSLPKDEILKKLGSFENKFNINMQRFPYASWTEDPILEALQNMAGMIVLLSFVYTCINTVKVITNEKEKQLKEAMKIMGLPNWLHWTAWFVKTFTFLLISTILITVLLKVAWYPNTDFSVFTKADATVLFVFFLFYICSVITFCFAVSVFFSKANTAATLAAVLWFLAYVPYFILQQNYDTLTLSKKIGASIGMNSAMAYGLQLMLMFEGTGEGIQWDNIFSTPSPDDNLTLGYILLMLLIDTFIYLLIALYVEQIFPGEYGVPKPWYFPFTSEFWLGHRRQTGVRDSIEKSGLPADIFEKEPGNLNIGIQISHLKKVFKQNVAVKDLTLNMYEDQITVLLGHNGAGKTTTMSMLTGMFPPTSGTATINNHDIRSDMDGVRSSLGLCPQHNILFDELTVHEHLYFYSKLKGMNKKEIAAEIKKYVNLLELQDKEHSKSSTLSGGMKRKLCVGMALCGNSKVVMLDEPTAGMDPSARRALWELLQCQKEGRTMLLTTHFMDEADLLGDRIAIMAGGELQCCGSSFFLKKKYGAGYHLIMDKSEECNPEKVTEVLKKHIPHIEVHSNIGSELSYLLEESYSFIFEEMLQDVENNSQRLGIRSYGISLTTLEEVFMKVGADHGQERLSKDYTHTNGNTPEGFLETKVTLEDPTLLEGFSLIWIQYMAMFMKKMISTWRSWILQLITVLLPVLFLIFVIIMSKTSPINDLPALNIDLSVYDKQNPSVLMQFDNKTAMDLANYYNSAVDSKAEVVKLDSISEFMLKNTKDRPAQTRRKYLVGVTIEEDQTNKNHSAIAWFNNDAYHATPLAYSLALNAVLKQKLKDDKVGITFINHPMPYKLSTKFDQLIGGNSLGFQVAFNLGFSMTFVSAFYILYYIKERVSKSKHLQFVSGIKVFIFWSTSYISDIITFIVSALALIITFAVFQEDGFSTVDQLGRVFFILLYFGFSVLPMMYVASFFFEVPSTGYTRMCLFSIFTGDMAFLIIQLMQVPSLNLEAVGKALHWVFLAIPHYNLCTSVRNSFDTFAYDKLCDFACNATGNVANCSQLICDRFPDYCCGKRGDFYKWESPGIGPNILYALVFGLVVFCLLIIYDYKVISDVIYALFERNKKKPVPNPDEDNDVAKEKEEIRNTFEEELKRKNILVLKDVTKYYKNFLAVNDLCLGVKRFECFGLLGVNGAGKTTTFKMMTGDIRMTYGDAWVKGFSINNELKQVQKFIGYCPQFDALLDDLTARESLIMFCLIRGIPYAECNPVARKLAKDFDFTRHLDKQIKELSGGNKRKVSTAISLIGDPPVLYLDEPTTGMDVATKRYLWNALCALRDEGKCIILTSHSMEECEALCTRLAIMVNGNFKCLGSTQHLKSKFAKGYTLTIKVKKHADSHGSMHSDTEAIKAFIRQNFSEAELREEHQELLTYHILDTHLPWSRMFGILEKGKRELNIEDYSLGQSSLEQVFLSFTKLQRT